MLRFPSNILSIFLYGSLFAATDNNVAQPPALDALVSDATVHVEYNEPGFWAFLPQDQGNMNAVGMVFYPGGFVDERSYAPICRSVAERGFPVFLAKFPFGLAFLDIDVAGRIMSQYSDPLNISAWSIGGHSLGAAGANSFVASFNNDMDAAGQVKGLFMLGGTGTNDISDQTELSVLLVRGSLDALFTESELESSLSLLPSSSTRVVVIEGGNHYQMGTYGTQFDDNKAKISREAQQAIVVEQLLHHLSGLDDNIDSHSHPSP